MNTKLLIKETFRIGVAIKRRNQDTGRKEDQFRGV